MSPVEQAAKVYELEVCKRTFREDLEHHLINGYVYSTPSFFVMGRPVQTEWRQEDIVNPVINGGECNCWHVYLFAGDIRAAMAMFPYPLPWVSFERKNVLKVYRLDALNRLTGDKIRLR